MPPTAGEGSEDATVVRTMYRALGAKDDSIFARCLDPQAEWIHPMVARLPEQPTPIFADCISYFAGRRVFLSRPTLILPAAPRPRFLVQKSGLQALHQKAALNQKSPS